MRAGKIAIRYATALFDLAKEQDLAERINDDMRSLSAVCDTCRDFRIMLQSPVIRPDKKFSVFSAVFDKTFHKLTLAYVNIIMKKRREVIIHEIAAGYISIFREFSGVKAAIFTTAIEPEPALLKNVKETLEKQLNVRIELSNIVDRKLLGGYVLAIGDIQIDTSLRSKINRLTREFNVNIYKRKF